MSYYDFNCLIKHTNNTTNEPSYIDNDKFPEQLDLVGSKVKLKYKTHFEVDQKLARVEPFIIDKTTGDKIYSRPKDDLPIFDKSTFEEEHPEDFDPKEIFEEEFTILRADKSYPYVLIGINDDKSILIVNSTKGTAEGYEFETNITVYPVQYSQTIGEELQSYYRFANIKRKVLILRCDNSEPLESVCIEYLNEDETEYRFITGYEAMLRVDSDTYDTLINGNEKSFQDMMHIRQEILKDIV